MPLQLPNLDDRTFRDLVEEARRLIPTVAPEWTNHNPSDPGITLIELFAYIADISIYRLNRVTTANAHSFLRLLRGPKWSPSGSSHESLEKDIRETVLLLRERERAVTADDFEFLAQKADARVARVRCLPARDLTMDLRAQRPGHVSVIVVPRQESKEEIGNILDSVRLDLEPRRLLGTQLHVVGPFYHRIDFKITFVPKEDELLPEETGGAEGGTLLPRVRDALAGLLHPLTGGEDGGGWPFGRSVYLSEIYELVDRLPGIDYVTEVKLSTPEPERIILNGKGTMAGVHIQPHELVEIGTITVETGGTQP